MKAQWSGMTAPAMDPRTGDRWDNFLEDVSVCPQCGVLSILHRQCPKCGAELTPVWQGSVRAAAGKEGGLRVLSWLLLIGAFTALALCGFGVWGTILVIVLAVIAVLVEIAAFRSRFRGKNEERNLCVVSMESAWGGREKGGDAAACFRSLERTRDAYYEDLLWLDAEVEKLAADDSEGRDRLFCCAGRIWARASIRISTRSPGCWQRRIPPCAAFCRNPGASGRCATACVWTRWGRPGKM